MNDTKEALKNLEKNIEGELHYSDLMKHLYATDASVYRLLPLAVAFPKSKNDIKWLIDFAFKNSTSLIPRTAGTSLAGQCVGSGIVVDVCECVQSLLHKFVWDILCIHAYTYTGKALLLEFY